MYTFSRKRTLTHSCMPARQLPGLLSPRSDRPPPPDRANRVTRPTLLRVRVCSEDPSVLQRAPRLTAPTLSPAVPPSPRSHLAALPAQRIPSTVPLHRTHPPPPPLAVLRRPRPPDPRRPSAGSPHTHSSERAPVLVTGSQLWSSTCLSWKPSSRPNARAWRLERPPATETENVSVRGGSHMEASFPPLPGTRHSQPHVRW